VSAVFDANVWVSAFQFGGRAAELVQQAKDAEIEVFISQPILGGTLRVLREKFNRTDLRGYAGLLKNARSRLSLR